MDSNIRAKRYDIILRNLSRTNEKKQSYLHLAAIHGDMKLVQDIIANIRYTSGSGLDINSLSPFMLAIKYRHNDVAMELVKHAYVGTYDPKKQCSSLLCNSIKYPEMDEVNLVLLSIIKIPVKLPQNNREISKVIRFLHEMGFHYALRTRDTKLITEYGQNLAKYCRRDKLSDGDEAIIDLLMQTRLQTRSFRVYTNQESTIRWSISNKKWDIFRVLCNLQHDFDHPGTLIFGIHYDKHLDMLWSGINPNQIGKLGNRYGEQDEHPLDYAYQIRKSAINDLLRYGSDPNKSYILHRAIDKYDMETVRRFVNSGVNRPDRDGRLPLHLAVKAVYRDMNPEIYIYLLAHGADPYAKCQFHVQELCNGVWVQSSKYGTAFRMALLIGNLYRGPVTQTHLALVATLAKHTPGKIIMQACRKGVKPGVQQYCQNVILGYRKILALVNVRVRPRLTSYLMNDIVSWI